MVTCCSLNKEAPPSIALDEASNLVKLSGTPDVGKVYHKTPTSSKPLSRSQRCFSQFDRKTDCFDSGLENGSLRDFDSSLTLMATKCQATFEAVCLTQTRHGGSVNKNQPCSQIKWEVAELVDAAGSCRWVPAIPDERYFEVSPSFVGSSPTFLRHLAEICNRTWLSVSAVPTWHDMSRGL